MMREYASHFVPFNKSVVDCVSPFTDRPIGMPTILLYYQNTFRSNYIEFVNVNNFYCIIAVSVYRLNCC
jgi:hypothetical protein